jgi:hypothetical protein
MSAKIREVTRSLPDFVTAAYRVAAGSQQRG